MVEAPLTRLVQPNQLNFKKTNVMKTSNQRQHIIINMSQKEFESSMEYVLGKWLTQRIEEQNLLTKTYTRKEAASFLNVTPQTVSKLVYNGKLNPIMTGRKMIFTRQELVNYFNTKSKVRWKM